MADGEVPGAPGETGAHRALGERRRRRAAERTGQVDLDATMSHWPVVDPPTTPRPVVRPARPILEGVATGPVLPTPGATVLGPLLQARSATAPGARRAGSRRARRGAAGDAGGPAGPAPDVDAPATGPTTDGTGTGTAAPVRHVAPGADRGGDPARPAPAAGSASVTSPAGTTAGPPPAAPRPVPASPGARPAEVEVEGPSGLLARLGRRGLLLVAAAAALVLLLVVVLVLALSGGGDPAQALADAGEPSPRTPSPAGRDADLDRDRGRGEAVAVGLGLPEDPPQVDRGTLVDTEVVVVLGDDLVPLETEQTTDAGTASGSTPSGEAP